ncbi:type III-B CRISPR-associated protein Cas10/Cmr2 [Yanghanlia caeni]|uniref:Type III-B CRISPR-associated protein Cas10/Cmr2 n=1 Tax=Yanghanlia caeni TaxID=3064283 RepID=A0ABU1D2B8_9BURK|nr:type III-B CRISPR-associated protein Cas10/Cmr2 [Alcaligenaceae bacterium LG-2]
MTDTQELWKTKVAARLHDPAEKALVLLRDPAGHENGTSRALARLLGLYELSSGITGVENEGVLARTLLGTQIPAAMYRHVQRADWWAAAADRPQFPMDEITVDTRQGERTLAVSNWAQVNWAKAPVLIHPLTGEQLDLRESGGLMDTAIEAVKDRSLNHFSELALRVAGDATQAPDWRALLLAFWRFGPDLRVTKADTADNDKMGILWEALPADTRIPDHSIWDHLDLTSAFAGAFAGDDAGEVSLLTLSIGPVQSFIAAARSTSDLWAGSHLLSRLSWEAMRPVCERLGPDAILFPRLRGIPQVDLWLRDTMGLPDDLFAQCDWQNRATDANPLFSAALPNRFVALVPAGQARKIVELVQDSMRTWLSQLGEQVVAELLAAAGYESDPASTPVPFEQLRHQLNGFPEVHWAIIPFSLIKCRDVRKQRDLDITQLSAGMRPFFDASEGDPGFLSTAAWRVLKNDIELVDAEGRRQTFMAPNPGALYPAVYELAERVLAAAKSTRTFEQTRQEGWRCTLTGENEWLTTDREQLGWNSTYRRKQGTLWTILAQKQASWVKEGEHLSALPAIKRVWPTLFRREVERALRDVGDTRQVRRFVVSTHTMAIAHQLDRFVRSERTIPETLAKQVQQHERVALPAALARQLHSSAHPQGDLIARIPGWLEHAAELAQEPEFDHARRGLEAMFGERIETYYGLLMMDGDRMGAILAGDEDAATAITYEQSFHPRVREGFRQRALSHSLLGQYAAQARPVTPNRHMAISAALNDFSQVVARHVVEKEFMGRLIYAGGDDVLAMVPVADLLPAMLRLRYSYSGITPFGTLDRGALQTPGALVCKAGYAWLGGRLMRMMGKNATASCGAVIAHHKAPLSAVMRELRAAEKRAKNDGNRDAFSITVIKRSGGALYLTEKWGEPVNLLMDLRQFLTSEKVSRRAVYHTLAWLEENSLPLDAFDSGLAYSMLAFQLERQADRVLRQQAHELAARAIKLAQVWQGQTRVARLRNFLSVAEFLAREVRAGEEQ